MIRGIRQLWHTRRGLLLAFVVVLAVTLFLVARTILLFTYWQSHRDAELQPWMTLGYVERSYGLPPRSLRGLAGEDVQPGQRLTLAELAAARGMSLDQFEQEVQGAIDAARDARPQP